jgi:hypothetical protein
MKYAQAAGDFRPGQTRGPILGNKQLEQVGCNPAYFQAFQSLLKGGQLDPTEGYVFWNVRLQSGAAGSIKTPANPLQVPSGFYLLLFSVYVARDSQVAADWPSFSAFISPTRSPDLFTSPGAGGFIVGRGPLMDMAFETSAGAIPAEGDHFNPWMIVPANFYLIPAIASGSGVAVNVDITFAGLLLKDAQNPDVREVL